MRKMKEDELTSRLPVIVLTSDKEAEVESLNSGASDFISKPYPMNEIIRARIRRRYISSLLSPGPRVPMPPASRLSTSP